MGTADFAAELSDFSVVAIEIRFWRATGRTAAVIGDVAGFAPGNRSDLFTVAMFQVRDEELPVPFMLMELDCGKFINLEFLVFRRMGVIKSPLLEWNISADKI